MLLIAVVSRPVIGRWDGCGSQMMVVSEEGMCGYTLTKGATLNNTMLYRLVYLLSCNDGVVESPACFWQRKIKQSNGEVG
jgi:hypothetical protein